MNADLELQILPPRSVFSCCIASRILSAAATARSGEFERGHHRIADSLDHGAVLGGDDLMPAEMRAPDRKQQSPTPLVKHGRAFEVGEQKGEAGDL